MKFKALLMVLASAIISTTKLSAQKMDCVKQGAHKPQNNCSACSLKGSYNVIVQNFLEVNEITKMEEELKKMVESADAMYKTYGNVKQKGFDALNLDLKKLFDEMEQNPQKAKDLISWMEDILEKGGCIKTNAFDTRSDGVSNNALMNVSDNMTGAMNNFKYPAYTGPSVLTFDCCQGTQWQPNDQFISNSAQIHNQFVHFKSMFEDFKKMQQIQMNAIQFAAWQFQKYNASSKAKMDSLVNSNFFSVMTSLAGQSGLMTPAQATALNSIIANYQDNKDKISAQNAIRQLLGDDAAQVYGFMFDNYTAEELLGSFGDLIKSNPAKFKSIQGLASAGAVTGALSSFLNLVQIAQSTVNIFFDTFLKLGGNSYVIEAQNRLWCVTAQYYYYAVQSLLSNAAALYQTKRALQRNLSFFPDATIPMEALDSLTAENAERKIASMFGSEVKGTLQGNQYIVELPGEKHVVLVFGDYFCGQMKEHHDPETTPDPKVKKPSSTIIWDPGYPRISKGFEAGFICGTGWTSGNAFQPFFEGTNGSGFVQQHQTELNNGFGGNVFAKGDEIIIKTSTSFDAGIELGYRFNDRFKIKGAILYHNEKANASTDITVVRMIPGSTPSAPPTTQQTTEQLTGVSNASVLRVKIGPEIDFGNKLRGFVGGGGCMGVINTDRQQYTAGQKTFDVDNKQSITFAGAYLNTGLNIPLSKKLYFKIETGAEMLFVKQKIAINPGIGIGLIVRF